MLQKLTTRAIAQALVICPTREIAIQTQNVLKLFCDFNITSALVIGGTDMAEQKRMLSTYPNVLVATPGRLLDMLNSGLIWLQYTEYVVLDEADRMLDMGFEEELMKIHAELTGPHQTLLFSATLFPEIKKMAKRYAADFIEVVVGSPRSIAGTVEHVMLDVSEAEKIDALRELIAENKGKMIVFFNTIKKTDQITGRLKRMGMRGVDCLHSQRDQDTRERLIGNFRGTHLNVLLASDVVARGLDIPDVELVVNFDVPNHCEDFIHRLGRTGRAGKSGRAMSFYTHLDKQKIANIEKLINDKIPLYKYQARGRTRS
jgi:superfamily II DNA/RNA helicase